MNHLIAAHQARPADDPIFALNQEANARKAQGEAVINATVGALLDDEGKLAILPTAAQAVRDVSQEEWAAYAPIAGSPDFLDAVITDLFADSPGLKPSAVAAATPGGTGALRHAIANYLEPGQAILTTSYFWGPYATLCDEAGRRLETFSMFDSEGGLDVRALDASLKHQIETQKRVLLILNDPCHNPTGYSMTRAEWQSTVACLLARAEQGPITLFVDTAYRAYASREFDSSTSFMQELVPLLGKVGLLFGWSASKTFTHYGLRVGAIVACVGSDQERRKTEAALSYSCRGTWSNCSRGGMRAITELLANPAQAARVRAERAELCALLDARVAAFNRCAKEKGLEYPRYEGGFFVTVFSRDAAEHARRMREHGVFVVPVKGALRVALCSVAERDIARLVDEIARCAPSSGAS